MNELTASEITNEALRLLRTYGYTVWRQSNRGVKFRQHLTTPGIPDIIGWSDKGIFVGCEVKTISDKLSKEQHDFLRSLQLSGGHAYVATEIKRSVYLENYEPLQRKDDQKKEGVQKTS